MKKPYRNVTRTRNLIRTTFVQLLSENELQNITVNALVERANIAKSTFYNHYEDIYAVAEEFENEFVQKLSLTLDQIESNPNADCEEFLRGMILFLKSNENIYKKIAYSQEVRFFVEKVKSIVSKKIFEENKTLPFSQNPAEKQVQIRLLTNACIDTIFDYFKGMFQLSLNGVYEIVVSLLNTIKKSANENK